MKFCPQNNISTKEQRHQSKLILNFSKNSNRISGLNWLRIYLTKFMSALLKNIGFRKLQKFYVIQLRLWNVTSYHEISLILHNDEVMLKITGKVV